MRDFRAILDEIDPTPLTPGDIIKAIRKNFDITHEELCQITGLKRPNLSALENGRLQMTPHYAEILGAALGLHPATILFPNGQHKKTKELLTIEKRAKEFFKKKKQT